MAFACSSKVCVATPAARVARLAPIKALPKVEKIQVAALATALAVALAASPASAGVVLVQPTTKKAFQSSSEVASEVVASEPKAAAAAAPAAAPSAPARSEALKLDFVLDISPQSLWPIGVVFAGGALFAISKLDPAFANILDNVAVKDTNIVGIGSEDNLKGPGGFVSPYYDEFAVVTAGTKALKKKTLFGKK